MAAISYDAQPILQHFAERADITLPLLSDPESQIIRAFGILNTDVPEDHQFYGIPHPGEYLIDSDGVVRGKYFEDSYRDRFTAGQILVRTLGGDGAGPVAEVETDHLKLTAWASDAAVRGGNRFSIGLTIALDDKMHVYAPGVEGYIPIDWTMEEASGVKHSEPEYPESQLLHLPAINETAAVYENDARIVRDVAIGQRPDIEALLDSEGRLVLKGSLRYQACDDKVCYLPQTVPLEWRLPFEDHDRTRAPEELRSID